MPSVTRPVTVNLSGSGSDPPEPPAPVLPVALAVAEVVLEAAAPPALLEAPAAVVGSEEHAATSAVARAIEEKARVFTRRA